MCTLVVIADGNKFVATATTEAIAETKLRELIAGSKIVLGPWDYTIDGDGWETYTDRKWPSETSESMR